MRANLAKIFGGIAILLIILILVGFLRPAHWTAEASVEAHLDPAIIFTYLNDLEKWDEWTIWSDIDSEVTDPSHGEGAMRIPVVRVERDARFGERLLLDLYVAAEGLAAAINDEFFSSRSEAQALRVRGKD